MPVETGYQENFHKLTPAESVGKSWYEKQRYVSVQFELALGRAIEKYGTLI